MNVKQEKTGTNFMYLSQVLLPHVFVILAHVSAQNFQLDNFYCANIFLLESLYLPYLVGSKDLRNKSLVLMTDYPTWPPPLYNRLFDVCDNFNILIHGQHLKNNIRSYLRFTILHDHIF